MREKEFDQFFQDRLSDHSSPVPEDMWQRIQGKDDDRRAFVLWWWIGAGLVVGCLAGGYFLMKDGGSRSEGVRERVVVGSGDGRRDVKGGSVWDVRRDGGQAMRVEGSASEAKEGAREAERGVRAVNRERMSEAEKVGQELGFGGRAVKKERMHRAEREKVVREAERRVDIAAVKIADIAKARMPVKAPGLNARTDTIVKKKEWMSVALYASPANPYNAGVRLSYPIGKGFSVITGFQYTRANTTKYRDSMNMRVPSHSTHPEVPVLIGYTKEFKRMSAGVNTGLIIGNGSSFYLGLDLEEKLGARWSLFAEPYFRRRGSGVSFGLRYTLKKHL